MKNKETGGRAKGTLNKRIIDGGLTAKQARFVSENLNDLNGAWTAEMAACVAKIEVVKKNAAAGDRHTDTVVKLWFWNKNSAVPKDGQVASRAVKLPTRPYKKCPVSFQAATGRTTNTPSISRHAYEGARATN